jgi:DnaJ-class molecular chaperone
MAAKDLYEKDFYSILGVDKKAGADEIKKKYRSLARELHPDKTKGDDALEEKFKAVSEAYDILSDSKKRAEYDEARSLFERGGFRAPMGGQNQGGDFSDLLVADPPMTSSQTYLVAAEFVAAHVKVKIYRQNQQLHLKKRYLAQLLNLNFQQMAVNHKQLLLAFLQELTMVQKFASKVKAHPVKLDQVISLFCCK